MRVRITQEIWKLHLKMAKAGLDICARPTVLPNGDFFPFKYAPDADGAEAIARVLCRVCGVPEMHFRVLPDDGLDAAIESTLVRYSKEGPAVNSTLEIQSAREALVRVRRSLLHNAKLLSGELLRHVVLMALKERYGVPVGKPKRTWFLVDIASVYLGCGVIAANAAFEFIGRSSGWTAKSAGTLTEGDFGYALALYAFMKGQRAPGWVDNLDPNVRASFKAESKALAVDPRFALCDGSRDVPE